MMPRRKPHRVYGYSEDIRSEGICTFAIVFIPLATIIAMGMVM